MKIAAEGFNYRGLLESFAYYYRKFLKHYA